MSSVGVRTSGLPKPGGKSIDVPDASSFRATCRPALLSTYGLNIGFRSICRRNARSTLLLVPGGL